MLPSRAALFSRFSLRVRARVRLMFTHKNPRVSTIRRLPREYQGDFQPVCLPAAQGKYNPFTIYDIEIPSSSLTSFHKKCL